MDWGMRSRLARIIPPDTGRTVMLAADHGYFLGPTTRLEAPRKAIEPLIPHANALMLTRGVLRTCVDPGANVAIVLRVSGATSIAGDSLANEGIVTPMKEAVRLGAVAVAASIFVGTPYEHQTLMNLTNLVNDGEEFGVPVLAVTAVGKELERRDARYLALCCRIAAELGAHLVKTYYCDGFEKVVEGCPVPVVVAGGPRFETEMEAFELVHNAVRSGAVGVDMGRNIWQHEFPVPMIKAIRAIVHQSRSPGEALEWFRQEVEATRVAERIAR